MKMRNGFPQAGLVQRIQRRQMAKKLFSGREIVYDEENGKPVGLSVCGVTEIRGVRFMEESAFLQKLVQTYRLGEMTALPQRAAGGYMHRVYRLETTAGRFAVKLLNPAIMKRPGVLQNYRRAERLECVLQKQGLPVLPAIELEGCKLQRLGRQYFYLFPWVEGKALRWEETRPPHCRMAGTLLAKIHRAGEAPAPVPAEKLRIDWAAYGEQARTSCPALAGQLEKHGALLYAAQEEYNAAAESLPAAACICDGDMDSKNVLWQEGAPLLIDLESLDYGNPFLELLPLALSWAGSSLCCVNYDLLCAFLTAYRQEYGPLPVVWHQLYGTGFSWLDWLSYNIRRALWLECETREEQELGVREAEQTIARIVSYASVREELLEKLGRLQQ